MNWVSNDTQKNHSIWLRNEEKILGKKIHSIWLRNEENIGKKNHSIWLRNEENIANCSMISTCPWE